MEKGKEIDPLGDGNKHKYTIFGQIKLQRYMCKTNCDNSELRLSQLEKAIMKYFVKYGERTIVMDNGEQVPVVDFIREQLDEDGLSFRNETYNKILEMSTTEVLRFISDSLKDDYTLSKSFANDENIPKEENIGYWLGHLMIDYKISIVNDELDKLHKMLRDEDTMKSAERCTEIMEQYKKLKEIQRKIEYRLNG